MQRMSMSMGGQQLRIGQMLREVTICDLLAPSGRKVSGKVVAIHDAAGRRHLIIQRHPAKDFSMFVFPGKES